MSERVAYLRVCDFADAVVELEGTFEGLNSGVEPETLAPGLYQTGAIALYEEQGASAVDGMMITSWDELLASGAIVVKDGAVSVGRIMPNNMPEKNEYGCR